MPADVFLGIGDLVEAKDKVQIDETLADYFRSQCNTIEGALTANSPDRARFISEGFAAHREGRYALSIPVFLAQADGISRELLGEEYFRYRRVRGRAEATIDAVTDDWFLSSALRALIPEGQMRTHSSLREKGTFNRHAVMHGEALDYDCELNSLKAASLLTFMSKISSLRHRNNDVRPQEHQDAN
jgi:hypothetical protein